MADKKTVTVYHPGGTAVNVSEERAETLRSRGYTDEAPGGKHSRVKKDVEGE